MMIQIKGLMSHKAIIHPRSYGVVNGVNLFTTVHRGIYCRKYLTSNHNFHLHFKINYF